MPRRDDIETILIIGSGPIVIGQGCEFDYSGAQACKTLRDEGYRIVLVNSNPATIMTDPEFSERTYIEPVTPDSVRKVIEEQERRGDPVHAVLPTLGGQTALNVACALHDDGTLERHNVRMIGANRETIHTAEDRKLFAELCDSLGLATPEATTVSNLEEARAFLETIGLPAIIRPAFTLGGSGGGIAYNTEEFDEIVSRGLRLSPIDQVQIDRSLLGWKEYELEVIRDKNDNCIVICAIENIDAMGVHTGDSITVAPSLTLTDKEYQALRDAAFDIMRGVGVETGGSNVQFAVNPNPAPGPDGEPGFEFVVVEMNPRVSRSSALASKATGFPIAKVAARLAVGYSLDELRNDVTGTTSACFEPTIDYVVTKMPRWTFEKFPEADETLTTQMKSVGEAMAIGRTFTESLQKAIRSMEVKRFGLGLDHNDKWLAARRATPTPDDPTPRTADGQPIEWPIDDAKLTRKLAVPSQGRLYYIRYAFKMGWTIDRVNKLSGIDPFFLDQIMRLVEFEDRLCAFDKLTDVPRDVLFEAKQLGYSDAQLANLYLGRIKSDTILQVRRHRQAMAIEPVYKLVDTCAAEFEAATPYYYSTYETPTRQVDPDTGATLVRPDDEIRVSRTPKVVILGGGPNRIGQGIEFDYCCVHAAFAAREMGLESVMINSNPETVSTDYDTSDLLFFEPLTLEDVLNVVERLNAGPLHAAPDLAGATDDAPVGLDESALGEKLPPTLRAAAEKLLAQHKLPGLRLVGAMSAVFDDGGSGRIYAATNAAGEKYVLTLRTDAKSTLRKADSGGAGTLFDPDGSGLVSGIIVQYGGQTPLNLAHGLSLAGAPIIGTSLDSIDLAEDRDRFDDLLSRLNLRKPASGIARTLDQATEIAERIGFPVLVRPSYVLGGRGMEICPDLKALKHYMTSAVDISELDNAPVLIDKFLDEAIEIDVDVIADFQPGAPAMEQEGRQALVCAVMEHIEQAGVHSGDSTCTIPPWSLPEGLDRQIRQTARTLAKELGVCGLMNVQMAVRRADGLTDAEIFIIEVNPRASRTVPFVGKAKHVPWARIAAKCMMGSTLAEMNVREVPDAGHFAVKAPVFPFAKFPGVDVALGPEMRSTGEVMGADPSLGIAFAKALSGAGLDLPSSGNVFISVRDADKASVINLARWLHEMGFGITATGGTAQRIATESIPVTIIEKIDAGARPNVIDLMSDGKINLIINTPTRTGWNTDEGKIRSAAVRLGVPMITTATGALAAVKAIYATREGEWRPRALQDYAATMLEAGIQVPGAGSRTPAKR